MGQEPAQIDSSSRFHHMPVDHGNGFAESIAVNLAELPPSVRATP
jgi:hypothetical protein